MHPAKNGGITPSNLILIWYSLWLLCVSTFSKSIEVHLSSVDVGELSTFLSACVLVLSVTCWGFRFGARASEYRDCYLELEELLSSGKSSDEKQAKYSLLLKRYPNHSSYDRDAVLFQRIVQNGEKLTDNTGREVGFGCKRILPYLARRILEILAVLGFFVMPLVAGMLFYQNSVLG